MKSYKEKFAKTSSIYEAGLEQVRNTPEPVNQKFPIGTKVYVKKDLGPHMSHFTSDCFAIVEYTYAHAYGGTDVDSYSLNIDGEGSSAWYNENQLIPLKEKK